MNRCFLLAVAAASALAAQDARSLVKEAQDRGRSQSQHYEGMLRVIDKNGRTTEKRWTYDRLGSYGNSKALLRFTAPAEVRGVALLIVNHPDRASDQWMWVPDIGRERRVALQDRSQRFFGTDFTFEDLEERDVDQYEYRMLGDGTMEGAACWKIESRPKKRSQYTHSFLWIRKDNYAFARVENYRGSEPVRHVNYTDIRKVQNIWTAHKLEMHDIGRNSRTILTMDKLQHNVPLNEDQFTLQAMRRAS